MTIETVLREYDAAKRECEATSGPEHDAAKKRLAEACDRVAELRSETPEQIFAKFDVLRDAIEFKSTRWADLRPFRLLHSLRKDSERLIPGET